MRLSSSISLALVALTTSVLASDVLDLTQSSFKKEVFNEDLALVEFFAPWCGHCKNLAPHYEEAATELKSKNIKLAKVDCTEEQALCGEYGVNGYPTLKVFRNGVPVDYTGPRKADGIISYMVKQSLPAVTDVTPETHAEFIKADKVVVVAYGDASHPIPSAFASFANTARDSYLFGQYSASSLPPIPESPSLPAIVLYKSFDEGYAIFPASEVANLDNELFEEFVKMNSVPLLDEISPENFGSYAEQGLPIAYLFVDPNDVATREKLVEEIKPIAKGLKGEVNFVYIDAIKFIDHGKSLNLPGDSWPAFVVQDLAAQTKFPLTEKATGANIKAFMEKFVKGEIQPSIKSAPIPTQDGPVYKLVADDWENLFNDESKDVFAEFFAPWCGHCQRLAPIWDVLGEKYGKNSNVIIAQMDATENDIPPAAPFRVQGFPTLKFRPAGSSEFIDYTGDRSLESLIEFVETNKKSESGASASGEVEDEEWEDEEDAPEHDEL
ncbi:protein disulfide-isomerase domain [Kwoniella shandongensis]|uniref:Protein disulfide-isomerase n=1 Tax=Kwoniella shandongensis TaxID=1734106 RepID=A0A5M6BT20_9TREE|nr:protein disulfide-isomerase domain [Kwoniella shandongensis]KAA5525162.1 protein disulfide-isomerase domain [Kwoniella shandongensis]